MQRENNEGIHLLRDKVLCGDVMLDGRLKSMNMK
jgi:hypothetical protein